MYNSCCTAACIRHPRPKSIRINHNLLLVVIISSESFVPSPECAPLRCFKSSSGVRHRVWPSSDSCELGTPAASSGSEIYGGVRSYSKRTGPYRDVTRPAELHFTDRPGAGHSVPGHNQRSACEWKRESYVCQGMHSRGSSACLGRPSADPSAASGGAGSLAGPSGRLEGLLAKLGERWLLHKALHLFSVSASYFSFNAAHTARTGQSSVCVSSLWLWSRKWDMLHCRKAHRLKPVGLTTRVCFS